MFVAELILIWIKLHVSPMLWVQLHMVTFCCIIYINYLLPAAAVAVAIFVIGIALNNRVLDSVECSVESLFLRSVSEEDMEAVKDVLFNNAQSQYVLKPQREGGGYNYYGEDLANKLKENCTISGEDNNDMMLSPSLSEFILMERLFPPQQRAILLRNGHVEGTGMSISELGCFGAIVASGDGEVVHNEYAGFLLRTKFSGVDEGGVASGFATLSSPFLC
jgi:glutathione synthase